VFGENIFIPILVNGILSLYITVPLCTFSFFDVNKKYFKIIPILVIAEAVIENILLVYDFLVFLYISKIVFYVLLALPVFIGKKNKYEKKSLEGKLQTIIKVTVAPIAAFMALLIPFSPLIFQMSYVSLLFWAVFTLSYQIPGLLYCKNRLAKKEASFDNAGMSSLTERENEIALAICGGLKYGEIAEKLFITLSTVKYHTSSIYRKLGIKNNRELLRIFMESPKNDVSKETVP
jgi:DNA-binding CsgD family transcriptional regulator